MTLKHQIQKRASVWNKKTQSYGTVIVHAPDCLACRAGQAPEEE